MIAVKLEKSMQIELAVLGAALFGLGVFVALQSASADTQSSTASTMSSFSETDFAAFDRDFRMGDQLCHVGVKSHRLCFGTSPHEARLAKGEILPPDLPVLPAEFPVIVITELKAEALQTIRFGRTLALIERNSRRIEDVLHLTAPSYSAAREIPADVVS